MIVAYLCIFVKIIFHLVLPDCRGVSLSTNSPAKLGVEEYKSGRVEELGKYK